MKKLRVAIIGQGRSGRDIHGAYFLSEANTNFEVVAVVDAIEDRRERAAREFGCPVFADYTELFAMKDQIDLVVNSTFSYMHAPITIDLADHGFNVVCEKPFARRASDVDQMIAAGKRNGVMVTAFQQSRFAPYYIKIKELLATGKLGELMQVSIKFNGFSRRWDWQTALRFNGGEVMNTGPHPMDQALDLMGYDVEMPTVFSKLGSINVSGDAEDYAKIILTAPGKPLFDIELSKQDAYAGNGWLYNIYAKNGSLRANHKVVEWQWFDPTEKAIPELQLTPLRKPENGYPMYCGETLNWHKETIELSGDPFTSAVHLYYTMIYNHLVNGAELEITAEQVRRQIRVNELIHAQNPLEQKY
ncbi:MAG: Gfo/Idh/MocA family oxidoreductase [Ruminococcaceae bacterium]|nr:Gfo/Idh/MocA family oxidoreductase [Oscillospiraceae bacterium]